MASAADERLQLLHELSRRLASFDDLDELLRHATRGVRELFAAEGSSILLLDRSRHEFRFPIASMSESGRAAGEALREVRFPADKGIAGWVLSHSEPLAVEDVRKEARFYGGVDEVTGITTRAILAAPLRAPSGTIGVIEVINPAAGTFTPDDSQFLDTVASDITLAYETADLHAQLRHERITLGQFFRVTGTGLLVIGALIVLATALANMAVALPWHRMFSRAPFVAGVLAALAGVVLLRIGRQVDG